MRQLYLLTFLTFFSLTISAQDKKFDIGFFTELTKRVNRLDQKGDNFTDIRAQNNIGFGLGTNLYYLANDRLKLRLTVGVTFEKETLIYSSSTTSETKISEVGFLTSGFHTIVKISKKTPLNIIFGATPFYGLKDNKDNRTDMDFKKFDLTGDLGLSYTISLKTFKIMPEIKYMRSFVNASVDNSLYGQSIDSYFRDRLNFSIYIFTH